MNSAIHISLNDQYQITGKVTNSYTPDFGPGGKYATLDINCAEGYVAIFSPTGEVESFVAAVRQALDMIEREMEHKEGK